MCWVSGMRGGVGRGGDGARLWEYACFVSGEGVTEENH